MNTNCNPYRQTRRSARDSVHSILGTTVVTRFPTCPSREFARVVATSIRIT